MPRPLHRAHARNVRAWGELAEASQGVTEEAKVEARVVGDGDPTAQGLHEGVGELIQARSVEQVLRLNAVNPGGSGCDALARRWANERGPGGFLIAVGVKEDDTDFEDVIGGWGQTRGLKIDNGVARGG